MTEFIRHETNIRHYLVESSNGINYNVLLERFYTWMSSAPTFKATITPVIPNRPVNVYVYTFQGHCYDIISEAEYIVNEHEKANPETVNDIYMEYACMLYDHINRMRSLIDSDIDSGALTLNVGNDGKTYYWLMDGKVIDDIAIRIYDGKIVERNDTRDLFC